MTQPSPELPGVHPDRQQLPSRSVAATAPRNGVRFTATLPTRWPVPPQAPRVVSCAR